eukprot:gene10983-3055_t
MDEDPNFSSFVGFVKQYLTDTGVTRCLAEELKKAEEIFTERRREFLRTKTLFDIITEVLSCTKNNSNISSNHHDSFDDNENRKSMIYVNPVKDTTIYGLNSNEIALHCDSDTKVTQILREKCLKLARLHHIVHARDKEDLVLAKCKQLPTILEEELNEIERLDTSNRQLILQHIHTLHELLEVETRHLKLLEDLVHRFRLGTNSEESPFTKGQDVYSKWLIVSSRKARYELRTLIQRLLDLTYSTATIPSLKQVLASLHSGYQHALQQHQQLSSALQEYNSLPDEFREIAKEYEDVQHDIQALLEIRPRS